MQENLNVSVIMATYNEKPEYIKNAVESILSQTYQELELLVFDDSTKDETKNALDEYTSDYRVKIFRYPERLGFVQALNKGLEMAQGRYIARMDADDIAYFDRLEKEAAYLDEHPEVDIVGGQMNIINEEGQVISSRVYPSGGMKLFLFSVIRNPLAHPTVMMRRELVDKGFRYDESLKMSEDLDLWLRILNASYKIANIQDTILNYRVADDFAEKRTKRQQMEYMAFVRKKNFSRKRLVHSILSVTFGWIFLHMPTEFIKKIYRKENNQKEKV